ncbi:MAG TPA: MBL fold metallo-hydrolase [Thermoanaerobaculia bacterium]|nr:MBL fold metallo-hydrolase [Thermoanaerobaculia bacterium]
MKRIAIAAVFSVAAGFSPPDGALKRAATPYVMVLGIAQDGGYPQAGCNRPDCVAAWRNLKLRRHVSSLAIVDPVSHQRWIIDATPDFPVQLRMIDGVVPDGILLTHAHIGHYLGLAQLGREVMGTRGIRVYAMPRMRSFLEHNGPWDQLVRLGNIVIEALEDGRELRLSERIVVTPIVVPHRDEYSETVAFIIRGPTRSILWLPDIDRWSSAIDSVIARVDIAYIDGTFYDATELPGRDLSEIPHPLMVESMKRFASERAKIRFIHLNQSNPALRDPAKVERAGFRVARERERVGL